MRVGFTGTRREMTLEQMQSFYRFISELPQLTEFHHGDCVGADDEAADALHEMRLVNDGDAWRVVVHPPDDEKLRAFNPHHDEVKGPLPYLERNRVIVNATDVLVACPAEMTEQQRGGTWSTVRYARGLGKPVVLIYPDGTVKREGRP